MELQLQVTEEELLEFPEIRSDQTNTSHIDNSAGEAVLLRKVATIQLSRLSLKNCSIGDQ